MSERTDSERLDWLGENPSRLQDVYWRLQNEDSTDIHGNAMPLPVREAIDWLWKHQDVPA